MSGPAAEVREWLDQHWDPQSTVRDWWRLTSEAGWQFPTWLEGHGGRGLSPSEARAVGEQFVDVGALGPPFGLGQVMGGPVVMNHGTDEQIGRYLLALAQGVESWCQFFSEPEAGSDLAGLRTTAERDGDEWVVNGQKVWTSGAQIADRGMLVARTNWDVPKHKGLSYFIIDVQQPGVEVRPLKQMNGGALFNEVFFSDARVSNDALIGDEGAGWAVAVTTLAFERSGLSSHIAGMTSAAPGKRAGDLDRKCADLTVSEGIRAFVVSGNRLASGGGLRRLASDRNASDDPLIRQELMRHSAMGHAMSWTMQRARAAARSGMQPGAEANLAKLARSAQTRVARDVGPRIVGADGMLAGDVTDMVLSQPATSIAGGSDEIQRNIIGERGLGLPKDIQVDRDMPFKDVKKSTT